MKLTQALLSAAMPRAAARLTTLWPALADAMHKGGIDDPLDQAAFLATIGHETLDLRYMQEIASGAAYEGRRDLGNVEPGDGIRFKGRGPIQITGRYNYTKFAVYSGYDCVSNPKLLEDPYIGTLASVWFWTVNGCGKCAQANDFLRVSVKVNGRNRITGLPNGWDDRQARYEIAKRALVPAWA